MAGATKLLFTTLMLIISEILTKERNIKYKSMNYILLWSKHLTPTYAKMNKGQNIFIERHCKYQNCFVTNDEFYFKDVMDFDAIVFIGSELTKSTVVPLKRSDDQLYVFASKKPAKDYQMEMDFDWFFNRTWTYRLDSDIPSGYIAVRNGTGGVVGPKREMHWMDPDGMASVIGEKYLTEKCYMKNTAIMWMSDNCNLESMSGTREEYASELENQMLKYGLKFDTFGNCGNQKCKSLKECLSRLEMEYYFYFAAEDSLFEDYVTENVLYPLQHFAVPIVYGGANYSRFLPKGAYLDAITLPADELALQISKIINNKEKYLEFFKWHKYYDFENTDDSPDTDEYCALCAMLNNERQRSERKVYAHFSQWWNEHPYETDELQSSLRPAPIVTYSPAKREDRKIILDNPYILTSRFVEIKHEAGFFGFIANLINYYFDIDI